MMVHIVIDEEGETVFNFWLFVSLIFLRMNRSKNLFNIVAILRWKTTVHFDYIYI